MAINTMKGRKKSASTPAIAYCRQSNNEASKQRHSIPEQQRAIEAEAKPRGFELAEVVEERTSGWKERKAFIGGGVVGSDLAKVQPKLNALLERISAAQPAPVLICHRVDRICRHVPTLRNIRDWLEQRSLTLWEVENSVNMAAPEQRDLFESLAGEAESYSRALSRNISRHNADTRGRRKFAGGRCPFGYRYVTQKESPDGEGHLVPHPEQAKLYEGIVAWFLNGETFTDIASRTEAAGHALTLGAIPRILHSQTYLGRAVTRVNDREEWYEAEHEPLIDQATWDDVQEELKRRHRNRLPRSVYAHDPKLADLHTYPWTGILRCPPPCGHLWQGNRTRWGPRMQCYSGQKRALTIDPHTGRRCKVPGVVVIREQALDEALYDYLGGHAVDPCASGSLVEEFHKRQARAAVRDREQSTIDSRRLEAKAGIERLLDLVQKGEPGYTVDSAHARIETLEGELKKLGTQRFELQSEAAASQPAEIELPTPEQIANLYAWLRLAYPLRSRRDRAAMLQALFSEVVFGSPKTFHRSGESVPYVTSGSARQAASGSPKRSNRSGKPMPYLAKWVHKIPVVPGSTEPWQPYAEETSQRLARFGRRHFAWGEEDPLLVHEHWLHMMCRIAQTAVWTEAGRQALVDKGLTACLVATGSTLPAWWEGEYKNEVDYMAGIVVNQALTVSTAFLEGVGKQHCASGFLSMASGDSPGSITARATGRRWSSQRRRAGRRSRRGCRVMCTPI